MLEKYTSKGIQVVYKLYTNQVYNLPRVYSVENVYNKYSLVYSAYHAFSGKCAMPTGAQADAKSNGGRHTSERSTRRSK